MFVYLSHSSIYHFDPSNLPSTTNLPGTTISRVQKKKFEKQKSFSNRNASLNSSSSLESSIDLPLGGGKNDCGQQTNNPSTTTTTTIAEEIGSEYCYDTGGSTATTVKICTKDSHDSVDGALWISLVMVDGCSRVCVCFVLQKVLVSARNSPRPPMN